MPVALLCDGMLSRRWPQCDGIWRPPDAGSSFAPTEASSISSGVTPIVETERAVAVVGKEPVVAAAQVRAGGDEHRLVPGAADLEECLALVLELDLLVVDLPRQEHGAVSGEQLVPGQSLVFAARPPGAGSRVGAMGQGRPLHTRQIMALSGSL